MRFGMTSHGEFGSFPCEEILKCTCEIMRYVNTDVIREHHVMMSYKAINEANVEAFRKIWPMFAGHRDKVDITKDQIFDLVIDYIDERCAES